MNEITDESCSLQSQIWSFLFSPLNEQSAFIVKRIEIVLYTSLYVGSLIASKSLVFRYLSLLQNVKNSQIQSYLFVDFNNNFNTD